MELDSNKLMAASGTQADNEMFGEYIQSKMKLYQLNNDIQLSTHGAANFMRNEVNAVVLKCSIHFVYFLSVVGCGFA